MKSHYDVALLGIWWGANYGSILNGYSVYKILKAMGHSVLLVTKHNASEDDWELADTHNARFIEKFYPEEEVSPVIPFEKLHELNDICDTFITGSDQIWNYNINSAFDMVFLQNFVDDDKRKISFATSFGYSKDVTPKNKFEESKRLFRRYNAISVRENAGVDICNRTFGVKATRVLEPVFCLDKEDYLELASHSGLKDYNEDGKPYILTYILDPTPEKREAVLYYSKISGMKAINVLDGNHIHYSLKHRQLNLPNTMGKIGAEDLMKLYADCSFVITDSFHGTAFSMIFEKPFISITNFGRGAVRFGELLSRFHLTDRLVPNPKAIPLDPRFLEPVDFTQSREIMKQEQENTILWLMDAIDTPLEELPPVSVPSKAVTSLLEKKDCTGCSACVSICPKDALSMERDELGYLKSAIDYSKCINCGLCSEACPALKLPEKTNFDEPDCYEFINGSEDIIKRSSSGGAFSAFAQYTLNSGGYVAGAAWKTPRSVSHIIIDDVNDLEKLQKSKYLQSNMEDAFVKTKELLEGGKEVLFSACPCQIAGLKKFLKKDYPQLFTIDIFCSCSPSQMFFEKYAGENFGDSLKEYEFRHKTDDFKWDCITVKAVMKDGREEVRHGGAHDDYQRIFHPHVMCSEHCENCRYQTIPRYGDISLGDFWGIRQKDKEIPSNEAVSVILCNSQKGKDYIEKIKAGGNHYFKQVPLEWIGRNGWARKGITNFVSPHRDNFSEAIKIMPFSKAVDYAIKPNNGYYRGEVTMSKDLLQYNSINSHFHYDNDVWEEHTINGALTLMVKPKMSVPRQYACMPLKEALEKGKKYVLNVRFRIKTDSTYLNFHIKDAGTEIYQIIYSHDLEDINENDWIQISEVFVPDSKIYDELMIGASQLRGAGNYIAFDYIYISEFSEEE